jgi:hypothetical protein
MTGSLARLGLLVALNALVVLGVVRLLATPVDVSPTLPAGSRGGTAPGAGADPGALDLSGLDYNQVLARPLFAPDRRPWQEPESPEMVELAPEPEIFDETAAPAELQLIGIGIANGRASALIVDPAGGDPEWVAEGDSIADWTVGTISEQSVVLEGAGGAVSLNLYPDAPE